MKKSRSSLKHLGVGLLALVLVLGLIGCKSSGDRSMAQQWGDSQVAHAVKKELAKDPMYKYPDVVPVVNEGTVQLTGFVDTAEQRQRAAQLAAHAKGARQIINSISLKPTPTGREQFGTNAPASPAPATPEPTTKGAGSANLRPPLNP